MRLLRLLEGIRCPFFDYFFLFVTKFGEETIFMALAMIIFWCVSKKEGYYILSVGFIGTLLNQFLKLTFRIPRPWVKDPSFTYVNGSVEAATGYSFPSGHTQNSVGTFGGIAYGTKNKVIRILSIVACVLIPFSRLYLGVHTPLDVFTSVVIALLLVFLIRPLINYCEKNERAMYIFLGTMLVLSVAYVLYVELYSFPADIDLHNYQSGKKNAYTLLGALVGMLIAYPLEKKYVSFSCEGKWYTQLIKAVVGVLLVLGLKELLKLPLNLFLPPDTIARAIRYALIVIFAVVIYPMSFKLIRRLEK